MGRIRQIDEHLATLIAAGEVVTGPVSVVRELVDNALDAGASSIDVAIEDGGRQSIRVADDGHGMDAEDAVLSLSRHATSKLATADDLMAIRTLGFRGEALAAILSVSQMRIETRRTEDAAGTLVRAAGGEVLEVRPLARRPGTTIEVNNLFYNTPARREFQDTARAEAGRVLGALQRLAVARPAVRFVFRQGDREVLNLSPTEAQVERIRQVFEDDFADSLIPVFGQRDDVVVAGFVTRPSAAVRRPRRNAFLVNGRPFESFEIRRLLTTTFSGVLSSGEHPEAVLYIDLPPRDVDVNVSPDKSQVRFRRAGQVFAAVTDALRGALAERRSTAELTLGGPAAGPPAAPAREPGPSPEVARRIAALRRYEEEQGLNTHPQAWEIMFGGDAAPAPGAPPAPAADSTGAGDAHALVPEAWTAEAVREPAPAPYARRHGIPEEPPAVLQVANAFLVCPTPDGMLIVDQHSAHERVNYERFRARWEADSRSPDVQPLMFPEALRLDAQRVALLDEMAPYLARLGFDLSPAGPREVLVNAVPAVLGERSAARTLHALLDAYSDARAAGLRSDEVGDGPTPLEDRLLMTMACHAAVKAGQPLAEAEIRALWRDLVRVDLAAHDVHGRPAVLALSAAEIARRMGRTL